jgi:hypothetical protein
MVSSIIYFWSFVFLNFFTSSSVKFIYSNCLYSFWEKEDNFWEIKRKEKKQKEVDELETFH